MERTIMHTDSRYSAIKLIEPTNLGYIHIAAEVSPRLLPLLPRGRKKHALIRKLKELAHRLEHQDAVEKVTVFDVIAFAPPSAYVKQRGEAIHVAHFDIVVLVETKSPEDIHEVQMTAAYQALADALAREASHMHVIAARNVKRVGDVDKTRKGLFLFNYFVGDDEQVTLQLWDYMAGWYEVETGLNNSVLLAPLQDQQSDYLIINHARWDGSLLRFLWRQMSKKSFRNYMLANLEANHVGAMPVLYRLA